MKIAIAGMGYVGLSNAILLSQNHEVVALDVIQEKVDMINNKKSPIVDKEIEEYLATKELNLVATTEVYKAYKDADYVILNLESCRHFVNSIDPSDELLPYYDTYFGIINTVNERNNEDQLVRKRDINEDRTYRGFNYAE